MSKRISSLFVEVGAKTDAFDRAMSNVRHELSGFGGNALDNFGKFAVGANQAIEALDKMYQAGKAVYEFARGAAQLEYSREKFDRLASSINATGDAVLGKLRTATRGLVSDAELVSSAGDLMGLGLAKTEDQVVRLTRVAGALGMNMNQLVLTLTNKTTMRFDSLNVAVDGFDDRLNKLKSTGMDVDAAFTEAFLQQAEEQIARVGEVADKTIGSYQRLEAQINNYKNSLLENSGIVHDVVSAVADYMEAINRLEQMHRDGIITQEKYGQGYQTIMWQWDEGASVLQELDRIEAEYINNKKQSIKTLDDYASMQKNVADQVEWTSDSTSLLVGDLVAVGNQYETVIRQSQGMQRHYEMWEMTRREIDKSKSAVKNYFDEIDRGIGSQIEGMIKDIEFNIAGGGAIQGAAGQIKGALSQNKITETEAKDYFGALYIETQELEVGLGNISADDAAQNISDTLGVSLTEARESMDGIISTMDIINSMEATARVRLELIDTNGVVDFLKRYGFLFDNPTWAQPTSYRDSVRAGTYFAGDPVPR